MTKATTTSVLLPSNSEDVLWDVELYLVTEPYCFRCFKRTTADGNSVQRCSRCRCAYYCSKECQVSTSDYKEHKGFCLECKKLSKTLAKQEAELLKDEYENYFKEGTIGHFWGLSDPRDYCRTRFALAEHILHQAHFHDMKPLYELGLSHLLELMRLIHSDNMGLREIVPFTLITLNRDQDAYDFMKWWITIDPDGKYDWGQVPQNTCEGDWLWLRNENIYEDFVHVLGDMKYTSLAFLASLLLIKLRLVSRAQRALVVQQVLNDVLVNGKELCDGNTKYSNIVSNAVLSYFGPAGLDLKGAERVIEEQEQCIQALLKQILRNNKMFLQSLVNPGPMRQQDHPHYISMGSPEEAFVVMNRCCRLFARTPRATKRLKEMVGENPQYEPKFSMF